ncbi:MAG: DUF2974 domain-containing protein [Roseburia sp.]|nr:DUF2974 domain-containing protein [Roseburia sp.]
MGTILDYIRMYGGYTFAEKPLNEVDSLIFSQFAYLKFDNLVPDIKEEEQAVDMQSILHHKDYDSLYADERYREKNTALFQAMADSKRFGTLKLSNYVNQIELERETQFSAITIQMGDGRFYVAYRGTDETIVGWKEDLNLAFSDPVPGQLMSVEYLNHTAKKIARPFYVGGHSKGGNLAVYAAMNCKKEIQDKIESIFNHDGPGFRPEVKQGGGYDRIEARIRKTIPHSSLVGMIFYSEGNYRVVESRYLGLAQHDPYSWLVEKDDFRTARQVYSSQMVMDTALNKWILSLDQEQIHIFVDTLYDVIKASEADNLIDFTANWKRSIQGIMAAVKNVDPETMKTMNNIMKALFEEYRLHLEQVWRK